MKQISIWLNLMIKQGKFFYCDLGAIGLMEKIGNKWKETKYSLKDCNKKRDENPKPMLKKPLAQLQLNCKNCKGSYMILYTDIASSVRQLHFWETAENRGFLPRNHWMEKRME